MRRPRLNLALTLRVLFVLLVCSLFALGLPRAASANTIIYAYTGEQFDAFFGLTCPPVCRIAGSFTLAEPLPPNLDFATITPLSFSFTDGSIFINNPNPDNDTFQISTDSQGLITLWDINLWTNDFSAEFLTENFGDNFLQEDNSFRDTGQTAEIAGDPGTWSTTPEPGSLILFTSGLLGVLGAARRSVYTPTATSRNTRKSLKFSL